MIQFNEKEQTKTISDDYLLNLITTLCELPETYSFRTINCIKILKIETSKNRLLAKALLQETLRKRFSLPERMENNQMIIEKHLKEV